MSMLLSDDERLPRERGLDDAFGMGHQLVRLVGVCLLVGFLRGLLTNP